MKDEDKLSQQNEILNFIKMSIENAYNIVFKEENKEPETQISKMNKHKVQFNKSLNCISSNIYMANRTKFG